MSIELSEIMEHEGKEKEDGKRTYTTPKGQNTSTAVQNASLLANHYKEPILMKHHHGIKVDIKPNLTNEQVLEITGFVMNMELDIKPELQRSSRTTAKQHERISGARSGYPNR